ncbi:MAG: hypothetical protein WAN46_19570 [Gammaproteobacteria bacterium]
MTLAFLPSAFDGNGDCTFKETLNLAGSDQSVTRAADVCTYSVSPDGSGTIIEEFLSPPSESTLAFEIVDKKKELRFITTDPGVLAQGVAKRQ